MAIQSAATSPKQQQPEMRISEKVTVLMYGVLSAVFFVLYYALSMRKQKPTTLSAVKLGPASYDITHFGPLWFWGNVALDLVLAVMNAVLVVWVIGGLLDRRRARRAAKGTGAGTGGAIGALAIAFTTFGCPTCTVPLAGTLGVGFFASSLPLLGTELKLLAAVPLAVSLTVLARARRRASCATG